MDNFLAFFKTGNFMVCFAKQTYFNETNQPWRNRFTNYF